MLSQHVEDNDRSRGFRLGEWLVEPVLNRISRGDAAVQLDPRTMDLLVFLARHPGDVLSQRAIMSGVWAAEFVGEGALRQTVASLRQALGDDARNPTYIETISKRGYRLIAQVGDLEPESTSQAARPLLRRPVVWLAGGLLVAAVIAAALIARRPAPPPEAVGLAHLPPRIVVTPFEHLGPPEEEYFADGVTTELIGRLSAVSELQVISRTSSMYYKGTAKKLPEIAGELGVDYVLEGTVRWDRSGGDTARVRITAQLIHADDDSHLWSESYDRVLEDPFGVQSDVARQVIDRLEVTLLDTEREALEARPTDNMDAYHAYLRGQRYLGGFDPARFELADEMFQRAVALDPDFALAHAWLSINLSDARSTWPDRFPDVMERAREAADRALELDPSLPEVHVALGLWHSVRYDVQHALEEYRKADRLEPRNSHVLTRMAAVYKSLGEWQQALEASERAIHLDPQNYDALLALAGIYQSLRRYQEAADTVERAIAIAPDRMDAYLYRHLYSSLRHGWGEESRRVLGETPARMMGIEWGWFLQEFGERNYETALEWLDRTSDSNVWGKAASFPKSLWECLCLRGLNRPEPARHACDAAVAIIEEQAVARPDDPSVHHGLGYAYAALGRSEDAIRQGERAVELSEKKPWGTFFRNELAMIYAAAGAHEEAVDLIEELLSTPAGVTVGLLRTDPRWDPLRDHPRFQELLARYEGQS